MFPVGHPVLTNERPTTPGSVALSEGHCPECRGRLTKYTPEERAAADTWAMPPSGYCAACDADVGQHRTHGCYLTWRKPGEGIRPRTVTE